MPILCGRVSKMPNILKNKKGSSQKGFFDLENVNFDKFCALLHCQANEGHFLILNHLLIFFF